MKFSFYILYLFVFIIPALITAISAPIWKRWCEKTGLIDHPGHRKIHSEPIALAGGLSVMTGIFFTISGSYITLLLNLPTHSIAEQFIYGFGKRFDQLTTICGGSVAMLVLGWLDDKNELKPAIKFLGQIIIALATAFAGVRITLFIENQTLSYIITVLWILTIVNAMNFLDNMNGLCAGLAVIAAITFGSIAAIREQYLVSSFCWMIAGGFIGFLPFNYPKATMFLGDAGSHFAGYLVAVIAILPHFYSKKHPIEWAVITPLIVLLVQLFDITQVVVRRLINKKPIYIGDTNHISHLLVRKGINNVTAVGLIWAIAALFGLIGVIINI
ncbi:MAG: MraY family glycosyltransferase [Verrucomicrobiia bacterium]